jgi:poly-gamma-glutamate synthesis protein (capsule biosynthesis protein)
MLGRNVEGLTDRFGPDYPFAQLTDRFARADAVVLNLEGPIVEQHRRTPTGSTSFSFPPAVADTLARHHVGLVTLANNHTLDRGAAGVAETSRHLAAAGVSAFGHPRDIAAANVVRRDVGGTSFTFVGFNDVFGVLDDERATALLVDLATREPERFLVVAIHWGDEYVLTHNRRQEQLAHRFVDAGVDLVVGHHPHVVQDVEVYRERLVFYSLGNFIFDQYFSPQTQEGLLVTLDVGSGQAAYQLTPVALPRSQPAPLTGEAASGWLSALSQRSAPAVRAAVAAGTVTVPWPPSNDWP